LQEIGIDFDPPLSKQARISVKCSQRFGMNVAVEIPDEVAHALARHGNDISQAVLEAVAIEAYRSGTVTPTQVQQMLGLRSRWQTEAFLRRAEAFHDYTMGDLDRDIAAIRDASRQ
jgi:predicted HTH domain antitoxin